MTVDLEMYKTVPHSLDQVDGHTVDKVEDITIDLNSLLLRWVLSSLVDLIQKQDHHSALNLEAAAHHILLEYVLDTCGNSVIDADKLTDNR